jgi:hypothetical protein
MAGIREKRIQKEYNQPTKQISGIMAPEAGNLPVWQKRPSENSLHPRPQPCPKLPPPPKAIEMGGKWKWR